MPKRKIPKLQESVARALNFIGRPELIDEVNEIIEKADKLEEVADRETEENKENISKLISDMRAGKLITRYNFLTTFRDTFDTFRKAEKRMIELFSPDSLPKELPYGDMPLDIDPELWGEVAGDHLKETISRLVINSIWKKEFGRSDWENKKKRLEIIDELEKHENKFKKRKLKTMEEGKIII
jgi:hypothetical protein